MTVNGISKKPGKPLNELLTGEEHTLPQACTYLSMQISLRQPNAGLPTSVFSVFTALAIKHNTINLGQVSFL